MEIDLLLSELQRISWCIRICIRGELFTTHSEIILIPLNCGLDLLDGKDDMIQGLYSCSRLVGAHFDLSYEHGLGRFEQEAEIQNCNYHLNLGHIIWPNTHQDERWRRRGQLVFRDFDAAGADAVTACTVLNLSSDLAVLTWVIFLIWYCPFSKFTSPSLFPQGSSTSWRPPQLDFSGDWFNREAFGQAFGFEVCQNCMRTNLKKFGRGNRIPIKHIPFFSRLQPPQIIHTVTCTETTRFDLSGRVVST